MNLEISDCGFESCFEQGMSSALNGQKTSLKRKCAEGNYLSSAEDNVLYKFMRFTFVESTVIGFIAEGECEDVSWKRDSYSDHLPVMFRIE